MRKFNNWENVKAAGDFVALPAGGYVAKIMDAKEVTFSGRNGDFSRLDVSLDIAEGEYQDYYKMIIKIKIRKIKNGEVS